MSQVLLASYGAPVAAIVPTDLAGLILWLDANAQSYANNDPVGTWVDTSGSGNDAVQGSGASQPTFKTAILNGEAIVRFDGSDDFMTVPSLSKGVWTIFYVYNTSAGAILAEHSVNAGSNEGDYHYIPGAANVAARGAGGFSAYDISAPSLANGTWRVISRTMDGTNAGHNIWVDGVLGTRTGVVGGGNPGTGTVTDDYYIGARAGTSLFTAGDISQILIYDNVLSDPNREGIEAYLSNRAGL